MSDETVRKLPAVEPRVDTGHVKFGDDWTGLFIRGDMALWYGMQIRMLLNHGVPDPMLAISLTYLAALLEGVDERKM